MGRMGKRAQRERNLRRLRPAPPSALPPSPPPPPAGSSCIDFAHWLGASGVILVLFETPSGFALIHYDGVKLFRPNALRDIWSEFIDESVVENVAFPKEFGFFYDKARAINSNGVCPKLAKMIRKSLWPGQRLAVGKYEYKNIIEANLGIPCLFDEAVLELMWGLKYLIKFLVPKEKVELTDEDRFQMCQGLKLVLNLYGFEVEPKMVNSDIIDVASMVLECDLCVEIRDFYLDYGRKLLSEVSEIDSTNWDELKLATALKLICYPEEEVVTDDSEEMLSKSEMLSKNEVDQLLADAHLYKGRFHNPTYSDIYYDFVWIRGVRRRALIQLDYMVNKGREELKLQQVSLDSSMVKEAEEEPKLHQGSMVKELREELQLRKLSLDSSTDKETKEELKLQQEELQLRKLSLDSSTDEDKETKEELKLQQEELQLRKLSLDSSTDKDTKKN